MPSIIFWGLSLCSMIARVIPTEDTGVRNRTKQPMQTIVVQSKLDFGNIESRMSNLEAGVAEVKSGVGEVNSAVADMKSLFAKFVGNANGGNGSLTVGGNNKTSNNIENEIEKKKSCTNEASCYQAFGVELSSHGSYGAILKGAKDWDQAREACQAIGEDLVTIASYEEQLNLRRYLKNTFPGAYIRFWIGSKKEEGNPKGRFNWRWINGEPVDNNLFFELGAREQYKYGCLSMSIWDKLTSREEDFSLSDDNCGNFNAYICTRKT